MLQGGISILFKRRRQSLSDHYYSNNPTAAHDRHTIEAILRGRRLKFISDAGVFSREGIDFGSKLLIETMEIMSNAKVLDVGCGYGPIGIAAATMAAQGSVTMIDINERAVELAAENARINDIHNVRVMQSDLLESVSDQHFTTVLTNPPIRAGKETVHRIFSQAADVLVPGGVLWVVIQKKQGAPSAWTKLESVYSSVEEIAKNKGYRIFKATK
jgi:16S rRNA (guanine1207-N2)-methyltransferase